MLLTAFMSISAWLVARMHAWCYDGQMTQVALPEAYGIWERMPVSAIEDFQGRFDVAGTLPRRNLALSL